MYTCVKVAAHVYALVDPKNEQQLVFDILTESATEVFSPPYILTYDYVIYILE